MTVTELQEALLGVMSRLNRIPRENTRVLGKSCRDGGFVDIGLEKYRKVLHIDDNSWLLLFVPLGDLVNMPLL